MDDSPGARLREFRMSLGIDQKVFAEQLGLSQAAISHAEKGRRSISKELLSKLFRRYGLNHTWLLYGKGAVYVDDPDHPAGNPYAETPQEIAARAAKAEFVTIRRYDVMASAGTGQLVASAEVIDQVAFTRSWLLRLGIKSDVCGLVEVRGDSMAPHIRNRALVLVHFSEREVINGHIYAFSLNEELFVKRLTRIEGGWLITSDNPTYPPVQVLGVDANMVVVHGRVRAAIEQY